MNKKTLRDVDLKGKRVVMRVDFNVPLKEGVIKDDTRIKGALPSIKYVLEQGGSLVLMSHLGRPDEKGITADTSLKPVAEYLSKLLGKPVTFVADCGKADAEVAAMKPGDIVMLENTRYYKEEQAKAKPDAKNDETIFEHYVSAVSGKEHPADLDEPAAMAAVQPPDITVKLSLPENIIKEGKLSAPQIEAVARAAQSFEAKNPDGTRRGFFIGDGTGVGKGREIAGIITDQLAKGHGNGKALWLSVKHDLANDARRDWEGLGNNGKDVIQHSKFSGKKQLEAGQKGVLFSAYSFFGKTGKRDRAKEIKDWLGKDFDGVIALDEAHTVNNVLDMKGTRGKKEAAKSALAVRDLIRSFPNARVVYVSATGATEIQNLAMLERLGLWGEGTAFPTLNDFLTKIGNGGMASLELVARDMKAMGLYLARSLSFRAGKNGGDENVTFSRLEHKLTDQQKAVYNEIFAVLQFDAGLLQPNINLDVYPERHIFH